MQEKYRLCVNAKANESSKVRFGNFRITLLTEQLIRLEYNRNKSFVDLPTQVVWNREFPEVIYEIWQDEEVLKIETEKSKMIAILINAYILEFNVFSDPYMSELFGEIETTIRSAGFYTIIQTVDNIQNAATLLRNWNVDGAVFLTSQKEEDINFLREQNICPMVFLDSYCKHDSDYLSVNIDDYKGGYIATKYLLSNGHKKIAFAGSYCEENDVIIMRYRGYVDALKEFGLSEDDALLIDTFTRYEDGLVIGRDLANHKYDITAIFATSDHLALGIIKGCTMNGFVVPNDLSVIGFDNLNLCTIATPELTTISQNVHEKAVAAVRLLLDAIEEKPLESRNVTCDVELAIRQTVQNIRK